MKGVMSLGICIGSSSVTFVETKKSDGLVNVINVSTINHEGNPKSVLQAFFENKDFSTYSVVATGRKFRNILNTFAISEPKAIENTISFLGLSGQEFAIASLGAENFMVYCITENGSIGNVLTGNKCASGTGEFYLQQIGRMGLKLEDTKDFEETENYYQVSGRCSVFCKSDCTHALNKGIEKSRVVSGLNKMIADKAIELLSKQRNSKVLLIGGVSKNASVAGFIKKKFTDAFILDESSYFEALGASLEGLMSIHKPDTEKLFRNAKHQYSRLEPLTSKKAKVIFKEIKKAVPVNGDECIIGLDVGSTTTKAVILRKKDSAILASIYLRTNGNPVSASVECYKSLKEQINADIKISGLGVTGSGRLIASLHALTEGDINEIIAHSVAAAYFDKTVDTIFEIGGQDAKYTYLTNGIASDYAMNEACSAGTGSFLEEAARESLNINYLDIADIAFESEDPINFNDQCSAFISSDIKNASHEGAEKNDIVAGLVYSVCLNYANRVKGNRPVGTKVFMQGGVCYNKAIPYAMSLITGKEIIVPPEPGLMGAFGVALEIAGRIDSGLYKRKEFSLDDLIRREFRYVNTFSCAGGKEKCDLKCAINIIEIEGKKYPFGGACNKYYNERNNLSPDTEKNDIVRKRESLMFGKYLNRNLKTGRSVAISKSFLTNSLYPFYHNFFSYLGFEVILSEISDRKGLDKIRSSYCYPVELSHGYFQAMLGLNADYIFLPHITQMPGRELNEYNRMCVFVQGESYFLGSAFREDISNLKNVKILSPVIDFSAGIESSKKVFMEMASDMGCSRKQAELAFAKAAADFNAMRKEFKETGMKFLDELSENPGEIALVLFGRPYNAYSADVNLNIPHKIASRGYKVIPYEFLSYDSEYSYDNMYWYSGNEILSAARFVKNHRQLFGVFITNFSCGPDSFIIPYFRKIMDSKPSLTLELDSHSADVGIETRIEAAIDIIRNYLNVDGKEVISAPEKEPLTVINRDKKLFVKDYKDNEFSLKSDNVEVIIPSMGKYSSDVFSAVFRSLGIKSKSLPVPEFETLKYGRGVATCKECLPLILTTGSLLNYTYNHKKSDEVLVYFMPTTSGPCRFGQYAIYMRQLIDRLEIPDVAVFALTSDNTYFGMGKGFNYYKIWWAIIASDIMEDIRSMLLANAVDVNYALGVFEHCWQAIVETIQNGGFKELIRLLDEKMVHLSQIPVRKSVDDVPKILLTGEIFVRRDSLSRQYLTEWLAQNGFATICSPVSEWIRYSDYMISVH
ncbi:MAG: acyl-CoA dehydratase activase, partial [Ignavibacteria bacterium]|nr:acyl-CoA dehydratase activase [Ignavibacteria bacterium]